MSHRTDKTNENLSPEKLNSPRQRRKITKEGPPSRAELEDRKRMLDEYKRAREERRRQDMAKRNGTKTGQSASIEIEGSTVALSVDSTGTAECIAPRSDPSEHIQIQQDMTIEGQSDENDQDMECGEQSPVPATEDKLAEKAVESVMVKHGGAAQEAPETLVDTVEVGTDVKVFEAAKIPEANESEEAVLGTTAPIMVVEPVRNAHLRLFKLSQIETLLACGHKDLASAMLSVLCAPGQKKGNDPMLRASVAARIERIRNKFVVEGSIDNIGMVMVEPEPTLPFPKPGHFSGSDSDQDETGSKLAMDVEEASRRHSIILSDLCLTPRSNHTGDFRSVQKAARFLAEDEDLMASVKKRLYDTVCVSETKPCKTRRVDVDLAVGSDEDEAAGSTVKYALLTPSKRIQEMLQTDLVISPVRRSVRNLEHGEEENEPSHHADQAHQVKLYDEIEEVDMTDVGYMPNRSIPGSPYKKTPKRQN